jgi:hypothetical protein
MKLSRCRDRVFTDREVGDDIDALGAQQRSSGSARDLVVVDQKHS